jgi:UDP-perosamine 4-acetyltransferase
MNPLALPPLPLVLIGGGGHGRVLADLIDALGGSLFAVADPAPCLEQATFADALHWRKDAMVLDHQPSSLALVNGVGAVPGAASRRRRAVYEPFLSAGYTFPPLCHPSAVIGRRVRWAAAVQVMAGAVVQGGCDLGFGVVINTRASIDHDCRLAAHVMISPGAVLCGGVSVGEGAYLGAGCIVTQGVSIGEGALIGAGVVVRGDVAAHACLATNP